MLNKSEIIMLVTLAFLVLFFGFYPLPLMETFSVSVNSLINNYEIAINFKLNMINNLNIMFPEIFLSLSIFSILMIGVFIKKSFNLVFNLTFVNNCYTILIILSGPNNDGKNIFR